ncbi:pyridoxamine 5'-phosphate oxidase [Nocardioides sp. R-C-SC26]|uniref:pyridoxamine 5'-phosphate oxidase n=1 Tax=Nocardioides sp. R-C-SC26 TaxID=2870414 RepID=UPI001E379273|nr:pyridoxamine 5'-phosphate oxidase [Nocardioides sp. R-C-SC26]
MNPTDLASLRENYAAGGLEESDLLPDPHAMFERWFADAVSAGIHEPNAMVVATASPDGVPSSRFVLLKGFDERGWCFYTNTGSRKGAELAANPRCALLFPWHPLERQVRVDGVAEPLSPEEVEAYFAVRPRGSQIGAWASPQSTVVEDRGALAASYAEEERRFAGQDDVPVPPAWGGYRVRAEAVEFWQGRPGRMHDRLVYRRSDDGWDVVRLAP